MILTMTNVSNYPPYNIVKTGDNKYDVDDVGKNMSLTYTSFNKKDINVSVENGMLTIKSKDK